MSDKQMSPEEREFWDSLPSLEEQRASHPLSEQGRLRGAIEENTREMRRARHISRGGSPSTSDNNLERVVEMVRTWPGDVPTQAAVAEAIGCSDRWLREKLETPWSEVLRRADRS